MIYDHLWLAGCNASAVSLEILSPKGKCQLQFQHLISKALFFSLLHPHSYKEAAAGHAIAQSHQSSGPARKKCRPTCRSPQCLLDIKRRCAELLGTNFLATLCLVTHTNINILEMQHIGIYWHSFWSPHVTALHHPSQTSNIKCNKVAATHRGQQVHCLHTLWQSSPRAVASGPCSSALSLPLCCPFFAWLGERWRKTKSRCWTQCLLASPNPCPSNWQSNKQPRLSAIKYVGHCRTSNREIYNFGLFPSALHVPVVKLQTQDLTKQNVHTYTILVSDGSPPRLLDWLQHHTLPV